VDARELFDLMPGGVAIIDRQETYAYVNRAGAAMIGEAPSELVGKLVWDVYPDVRATPWASALERVLAGGPAEFSEMHYAPSDRWTLLETYPVSDGAVVIWRDISELKRAQKDLERALAEQHELDQLRERLLGIVGHDLRTPLTAITVSTERLLRRKSLPPAEASIVAPILRSAKRMGRMISQILDFTRVRLGGGFQIEPTPTDLAQICEEVIQECSQAHPERQIAFSRSNDATGLWDHDRLCEVASNLVGNALQHGLRQSPVEVSVAMTGDEAILRVRNDGPPIHPELLPFVFDPFRRARPNAEEAKPDSLGLGLYITKAIVESHGGTIAVESSEQGTAFSVHLPRNGGALIKAGESP
jgi:PAS domain S-box-containing protein